MWISLVKKLILFYFCLTFSVLINIIQNYYYSIYLSFDLYCRVYRVSSVVFSVKCLSSCQIRWLIKCNLDSIIWKSPLSVHLLCNYALHVFAHQVKSTRLFWKFSPLMAWLDPIWCSPINLGNTKDCKKLQSKNTFETIKKNVTRLYVEVSGCNLQKVLNVKI